MAVTTAAASTSASSRATVTAPVSRSVTSAWTTNSATSHQQHRPRLPAQHRRRQPGHAQPGEQHTAQRRERHRQGRDGEQQRRQAGERQQLPAGRCPVHRARRGARRGRGSSVGHQLPVRRAPTSRAAPSSTTRPSSTTSTRSNPSSRSRSWVTTTTCCGSSLDHPGDAAGVDQVQQRRRLVEHDPRRPHHQHPGDGQQLLLPAGEQVRRVVGVPGQPVARPAPRRPARRARPAARPGSPARRPRPRPPWGARSGRPGPGTRTPPAGGPRAPGVRVSSPSTSTWPVVGSTSPLSSRANVLLPGAVGADDPDPVLGQPQVEVGEDGPLAVDVPDAAQLDTARGVGARRGVRGGGAGRLPAEPHRAATARCGRSMTG